MEKSIKSKYVIGIDPYNKVENLWGLNQCEMITYSINKILNYFKLKNNDRTNTRLHTRRLN